MGTTAPERRSQSPRISAVILHVVAVAAPAGGLLALVGAMVARTPLGGEVTPATRFVAFAFATMGLAWLAGPALVGRFDWLGLFRWATVVDLAGVPLVVAACLSGAVSWRGGLKLYAIVAAFAAM
ncbi:MAG: hypothetical protein PHU85_13925, partial [Phycisphaerae bacterium]|nr:hypothetical protein [Phycisphaerae bacterium]